MAAFLVGVGSVAAATFVVGAVTSIPVVPFRGGVEPSPASTAIISVKKTDQVLEGTKDPIWSVQLVIDGQPKERVDALIGRAGRQSYNRHTAGSKSPLPPGRYRIDALGIEMGPFPDPEVGRGYWVPIFPLFSTSRSFLGLHQDPSWGKLNGESGTSGCIGVKSVEDTKKVVDWIDRYRVKTIVVES